MSERVRGAIALAAAPGSSSLALDLSAGDGLSSGMLAERGWRVISTEYRTKKPGWVAANLDRDLPFRDSRFDLVLMLEVIEHLADIPHALGEIGRVLRPGGTAIVTTPNRLNVSSRIHYLLSGYYKGRRAPLPYRYRVEDGRNWHVMGLNDLHWIAWGAGLRLDALGRSKRKLRARILAPMLYPFIAGFSWMLYCRRVKDPAQRAINRELFGFMTSSSLLMDENIVMRFRKVGGGADSIPD
ncbi:MAG: class I SAM-dependent methyltransferase [Candidatus Binatus sp.]|uniref:class I SAM-dependent methyltransferase n=1 Tax=Candidatus Binatus sp. TaxID=2811406 RepID=UPI002718E10C|nr:class I SAM-dependent methyltransferase [Candidatus Binatus sp.]MDO8433176.1 class I SAM-dependent methyltransferase [Candidatus Binatus sp.]